MSLSIEEYVPLKEHTTFRVGGPARYFARVGSLEELTQGIAFAREKGVPLFILGGGSNVLAADAGFPGLVLKLECKGLTFTDLPDGTVRVTAAAGEVWDEVVAASVARRLYGLENMSGIPGLVGATPVQNVGAYGAEVKDVIESVEAFDTKESRVVTLSNDDCGFGYRDSVFKRSSGRYIILAVTFLLARRGSLTTSYRDVAEYFKTRDEEPTLPGVREAILAIRGRKFPDLREYGTAGSFFKNPVIGNAHFEELRARYPEMPGFPVDDAHTKVPAGWLIEHVGAFKGAERDGVRSHEGQALVLLNTGTATSASVRAFAESIRKKIFEETHIELEFEVRAL